MLEFAQYLAENHGKTLYVAIEEGFGYTLKDKIQRVGATSSQLSFAAEMPKKLDGLDFVFIDSISRGGMEIDDLIKLQEQYPRVGFIYIFHTTKDGRFRGGNHYAHEVDVIVEVSPEQIKSSGRFAPQCVIPQ
jgi:predicted ATP-dependent serine protease